MKFTDGIIGIEEFTAISSMCTIWREGLGEMLLRVLDLGEIEDEET